MNSKIGCNGWIASKNKNIHTHSHVALLKVRKDIEGTAETIMEDWISTRKKIYG